MPLGEALQRGRSDCGCAYEIYSDLLSRFRGLCGLNLCISVGFLDDHIIYTLFAEVIPAYLAYMGETSLWSFLLHTSVGWEGRSFSLFDGSG